MKKIRIVSLYVITQFFIETVFQIVFYSIHIKYFDKYSRYEKFGKILLDVFYVTGSFKLVFFLPLYFVFYFIIIRPTIRLSPNKLTVYHSALFLTAYLISSFFLPGNIASRFIDTTLLTFVAFTTSLLLARNYFNLISST